MAVIDFHSHILPGIDDGSSSISKSLHMCKVSAAQGVDIIVATPHFYASEHRVEDFLKNREEAFRSLAEDHKDKKPELIPGAEVAYFPGISQAEKISQLTIQGTDILLLELPFEAWADSVIEEVQELIEERGLTVMLAHLERYIKIPGNKKKIQKLTELPVYAQINAGSLTDWRQKRKIIKMFRKNQAHVLGSDCHSVNRRPPNLLSGREILINEFGLEFLNRLDQTGTELLKGKKHHV